MSKQIETEFVQAVMPTYNRFPITLVKGQGSKVWDQQGTEYLDFTSGIATCNLGHRPPAVQQAIMAQLDLLWHCSNFYHIPSQEQLAQCLVSQSCFDQVFFGNSGAEANEAAIKLVRRYAQKVKQTNQIEIVTFQQSFHGRTLATLSATGQEKLKDGFGPQLPGFRYLTYNNLSELDDLAQLKPIAVMLELVQGEGGVIPADQKWVDKLVAICHQHDILIIVDEVQTGMGRTGKLFAYQQYNFEPDVITVAKGLGSGFPIGAVLAKANVAQALSPGTHGSTFGGNPIATTAGLATLEQLTAPSFFSQLQKRVTYFWTALDQLSKQSDIIKMIRGQGFLIGIEIEGQVIDYVNRAREHYHFLMLPTGPDVIRLLPPLTASEAELDHAIEILRQLFVS
ncbi:aspartate aminotransferase family protein [Amphibacillus sediminis]|uniref:aspartate aminotransferase family protein n=1 Tax=Amphibacillus sediminis TaxID=360185 RepID=UPI000836D612|nr:aspartate aminotransferase family protein [Amphibacillus sediminis]